MKKKTMLALLAALCMSTAVAGFAACGSSHTHTDANGDGKCDECNEVMRYVVTFETNGGSALPKQGVAVGGTATKPSDPVRDGYIFDGWFSDEGTTAQFDFGSAITGDITVYARWKDAAATADTYFDFAEVSGGLAISAKPNVTLPEDTVLPAEHNGKAVVEIGVGAFEGQPALRGVKIPASVKRIGERAFRNCASLATVSGAENIEQIGYGAFNGTAWDSDFSVGEVYLGKTFYKYAGSLYADTQITLKEGTLGIAGGAFEGIAHLVGIVIPASVKYVGGYAFSGTGLLTVTVSGATPAALGNLAFGGLETFNGKVFVPGTSVADYKAAAGWQTYAGKIYAQGTAEQNFVVTFSAEGATGVPGAQTVKAFGTLASVTAPVKAGLDFVGWYRDANLTTPFSFDEEIDDNLTLYARFEQFYDVTFSAEGATDVPAALHVQAGTTVAAPEKAPEKAGNEFMGWYRDAACTKEFDFNAPITEATTVYAKFLANGANYTGEGEFEGWVIENGRVKEYTGNVTEIHIPKELTRLDSIAQIVKPDSGGGEITIAGNRLQGITSITVEEGSTSFKIVDNALLSYDESVFYFLFGEAKTFEWPKVVKIADYAFCGQRILNNDGSKLKFGDLVSIGDYAFWCNNGLKDFTPFRKAESIGYKAFQDCPFTEIVSDAKYIAEYAFLSQSDSMAHSCTVIELEKIVSIGNRAFGFYQSNSDTIMAVGGYRRIVIGPDIRYIAGNSIGWTVGSATEDCAIILEGETLPLLDAHALVNLAYVSDTRPKAFMYVREELFSELLSEQMYNEYLHGYFTEDGWLVREDGSLGDYLGEMENITLPKGLTSLNSVLDFFGSTENLAKCTSFTVENGNPAFKMQDGALLSADGTVLYGYFGDGTGNFANITEIKPYAFYGRLKENASVSFGTAIQTVGEYAFYDCAGLTSFTPFEGLGEIAAHAFEKTGLTTVTLSNLELRDVKASAFADCANLTSVYLKLLTVPTLGADAIATTVDIYVPTELLETYTTAWAAREDHVKSDNATRVLQFTFSAEGAQNVPEQQRILTNGTATEPEAPDKEGYFFDGWFTADGTQSWGVAYNFASPVTQETTVYAKWTKGVNVSYNTGESNAEVEGELVRPNGKAEKPADPKWEGHVFDGWYTDESCTEGHKFDFESGNVGTDAEGGFTLYAKWAEGKTVTFDTDAENGGSAVEAQSVLPGGKATRPAEDPTREGYKFAGWYTQDGSENQQWGTEFNFDAAVNEDVTVYAKWDEDFWKIDEDGKLIQYFGPTETFEIPASLKSIDDILDLFGDKEALAACVSITVEAGSESFKVENGALLSYDGTVLLVYFGGDTAQSLAWPTVTKIGDYAFYGHFSEAKDLTFSAALKSVGVSAFESTALASFVPFENAETLGANAFKATQLTEITWNTEGVATAAFANITTLNKVTLMYCTEVAASAFSGCSNITTVVLGMNVTKIGNSAFASCAKKLTSLTVYAVIPPTMTTSNHPLGGDDHKGVGKIYVPYNSISTYQKATAWNWYTGANNKGELYTGITLEVEYTMGEGAPSAPAQSAYWGMPFDPPAPEKWEGYVFDGWFEDASYNTSINTEDNRYDGFALYAKWSAGVSLKFNMGKDVTDVPAIDWQALHAGDKAQEPTAPERKGYRFDGWFTDEACSDGKQFNFDEMTVTENTTLYAKWTKGLTVEFDLKSGRGGANFREWVTVMSGEQVAQPSNPTRSYCEFLGWYQKDGSADGNWGEQFNFQSAILQDTKLYARWDEWTVDAQGMLTRYVGDKTNLRIPSKVHGMADATKLFNTSSTSGFPEESCTITLDGENDYLKIENGMLLSKDGTILYYYFGGDSNGVVTSATITEIKAYAFAAKSADTALTSVTLSQVTAIPQYAFYNRKGLATVSFGTLTSVETYAFSNTGITDFTPFEEVASIKTYAFEKCTSLKKIRINAESIERQAFSSVALTDITFGAKVKTIANAFSGIYKYAIIRFEGERQDLPTLAANALGATADQKLTFIVPDGKANTWKNTANWKSYTASKWVEKSQISYEKDGWIIGTDGKAILYTGSYTEVALPKELTSMDSVLDIFLDVDNLATCTSITVSDSASFKMENGMLTDPTKAILYLYLNESATPALTGVTEIKSYAFYANKKITSIDLSAVTKIGDSVFDSCTELTTVTFKLDTTMGADAFRRCSKLKTVTLGAVTTLGYRAFSGCSKLENLDLSKVTTLGAQAFYQCTSLTEVSLPLVTTLGEYALGSCSSLAKVTIGKNCTSIGAYALSSLKADAEIIIQAATPPTAPTTVLGSASSFTGTIKVPSAYVEAYKAAAGWSAYAAKIKAAE